MYENSTKSHLEWPPSSPPAMELCAKGFSESLAFTQVALYSGLSDLACIRCSSRWLTQVTELQAAATSVCCDGPIPTALLLWYIVLHYVIQLYNRILARSSRYAVVYRALFYASRLLNRRLLCRIQYTAVQWFSDNIWAPMLERWQIFESKMTLSHKMNGSDFWFFFPAQTCIEIWF